MGMRYTSGRNKNMVGIVAGYLVIVMGLAATMVIGVVGSQLNVTFVALALLVFLMISWVPYSASAPDKGLRFREKPRTWREFWSSIWNRGGREEKPIRAWKRKKTKQKPQQILERGYDEQNENVFQPN